MISIKLQSNFSEITLQLGCFPVNLLHIFRTPFLKNTSGGLLLKTHKGKFQYFNFEDIFNFYTFDLLHFCKTGAETTSNASFQFHWGKFSWIKILIKFLEPTTRGVLQKRMFLEILQNSQENTCARVSFLIKLQACNFIKNDTPAKVLSCEFCEISKNIFFTEHLWATASEFSSPWIINSRSSWSTLINE